MLSTIPGWPIFRFQERRTCSTPSFKARKQLCRQGWNDGGLARQLANDGPRVALSKVPLRFDLPWVPISTIAQQFYCKVKVDHEYKLGKVPTPEKEEGIVL